MSAPPPAIASALPPLEAAVATPTMRMPAWPRAHLMNGRLSRALLTLGLPIMVQSSLGTLLGFTDRLMVGQLGPAAINGVGIASQILGVLGVLAGAATSGVGIIAAQRVGARDRDGFWRLATSGLYGILMIGLPLTVALAVFAQPIVEPMMARDAQGTAEAVTFLHIILLGFVPMLIGSHASALLYAMGRTRQAIKVAMLQLVLNTVGNWMFIFGHGPFPPMGAAGSATATALAQLVGMLLLSRCALGEMSRWSGRTMRRADWRVRTDDLSIVLRQSLPVTLDGIVWRGAVLVYAVIVGHMGPMALSAYLISQQAKGILSLPLIGLAQGGAIMVGQALGGNRLKRAHAVTGVALRLGLWSNLAMGLVVGLLAEDIAQLFKVDFETHVWAVVCLQAMAILQLTEGTNTILPFILRGGGDANRVFLISSTTFWGIGIPLAWFLGLHLDMGLTGLLIAMTAEFCVKTALLLRRYSSGAWQRNLVAKNA